MKRFSAYEHYELGVTFIDDGDGDWVRASDAIDIETDLLATRRALKRAQARALRHMIESVSWGYDFAESQRDRVVGLLRWWAMKFEREAEEL